MPELITRVILLGLLAWLVWYVVRSLIPKPVLTVLGGVLVVLFFVLAFQDPSDRVIGALWDVISFPLRPLGLAIVLLAIALKNGVKSADGNLVMWALIVLWVFSTPLVSYWLMLQTQQTAEQLAARTSQDGIADVIVVLGDGISPADPAYRGGIQFNNPDDGFGNTFVLRLQYAGQLYQEMQGAGGNPLVIVSPGPQLSRRPKDNEDDIRTILAASGVPRDQIIVDDRGRDIRSSAVAVRDILRGFDGFIETDYTVYLIAPAVKIRRARAAFARGLQIVEENVVAAPTDFYGFQAQGGDILVRLNDIVPDVEALALSTRVVEEYLATVYYFIRGWLLNPLGL